MEQLKSIVGINNNRTWEGDIIVKNNKMFEGIVSNYYDDDYTSQYIKGYLGANKDLHFYIDHSSEKEKFLISEAYGGPVEIYDVVLNHDDEYVGDYVGLTTNKIDNCVVKIRKKFIDKNVLNQQMKDLKAMIDEHKALSEEVKKSLNSCYGDIKLLQKTYKSDC